MREKKRYHGLIICLAFLLLSSTFQMESISLQQRDPQEYEVTVALKLVQVFVTDKNGVPISDLEREDFELYEDGRLREITDFERHGFLIPSSKIETAEEAAAPPSSIMNRKFFLYFDFAFNSPHGIQDSKNAALHFIDSRLRPSDEVGILSFSANKGLTIHENLTSDHPQIRRVIEEIGQKNILGRAENVEMRYWGKVQEVAAYEAIDSSSASQSNITGGLRFQRAQTQLEMKALEAERSVFKKTIQDFTDGMKNLGQALGHIQGHKHIIFFSSGIPTSVLEGVMAPTLSGGLAPGTFGDSLLRERYEKMVKVLTASNSSVYTVFSEGSVQDRKIDMKSDLVVKQMPWTDIRDSRQLLGFQSLQELSEETGGKYFGNVKNYQAITEEIQNITGSYYVLGFTIDEEWDGQYHEIEVKVKRKGARVHAQRGYFNPKPFSKFSKLERQLHFIDLAVEETSRYQAPLYLSLRTVAFRREGETGLVMLSKIPRNEIQEISGKKVEIANLVFDDEENVIDLKRFESDFSKFQDRDVYYYSMSSLSPGMYTYRVVIRNLETGAAAVASSSIDIPEATDSDLQIFPPFLAVEGKKAFYLKGTVVDKKEEQSISLDLSDIFPHDFSRYTPVVKDVPAGTRKLLIVLPCRLPHSPQGRLRLIVRLIDKDTETEIPIKYSLVENFEKESVRILHFELQIGGLKAGNYRLDFLLGETESIRESTVSTDVVVKSSQ